MTERTHNALLSLARAVEELANSLYESSPGLQTENQVEVVKRVFKGDEVDIQQERLQQARSQPKPKAGFDEDGWGECKYCGEQVWWRKAKSGNRYPAISDKDTTPHGTVCTGRE